MIEMEHGKKSNGHKIGQIMSKWLWAVIIILVALLMYCSAAFYSSIRVQLYGERQTHLSELTIKISEIMNRQVQNLQVTADSARRMISWGGITDEGGLVATLDGICQVLEIEDGVVLAVNSKSIFYASNGYSARWSTPEDLEDEDSVPLIRELSISGEKKAYMVFIRSLGDTMVTDDGGTAITHIALAIPLSDMDEALSVSGFGGECYTYLINMSGRRLYKQTFANPFIEEFNILSSLEGSRFTMDGSLEALREAISNRENQCFEFVRSQDGQYYFVATVPIDDTDWSVLVFVPTSVLGKGNSGIMSNMLIYLLIISLIIICIFVILVYISIKRRSVQELLAQKEASNKELAKAALEANKASQAKTEFLSHMSHDIRTPINGIVGMVNIARKNVDNSVRIEDCLGKISKAADHLLSLINDVLEMSRIESGRIMLSHEKLNIHALAESCFTIIEGQLMTRNIDFRKEFGTVWHVSVLGDELRIRQIFINILGNAVKFTPDGGTITFRMKELQAEEGRASYSFEFQDTGIGMSEEFLEHIFEPFSQEDGGSRTNYQGTGLGMAITKQFVELMGGSINVVSEPGVGSRFTVVLDFEAVPDEDTVKPGEGETNVKGMKILLVEDNELNREIAQEILEDEGAVVTTAVDGQEAVDMFTQSKEGDYDAILMDVMMPRLDGYGATRAIRACARPDAATIPIIAMTANAYAEDVAKALESGMNAHIPKPIDIDHLFEVLSQYYNTKEGVV
jgi:signal transduction histidine kinase/ActR/RegA family two-component response regulator